MHDFILREIKMYILRELFRNNEWFCMLSTAVPLYTTATLFLGVFIFFFVGVGCEGRVRRKVFLEGEIWISLTFSQKCVYRHGVLIDKNS